MVIKKIPIGAGLPIADGVKFINDAIDRSNTVQNQLDTIIIESGTSDAEVIQARGEYQVLNDRMDATTSRLAEKVSQEELDNVLDGSPKGTYATFSDLQNAFPTGTTGVYIVTADGHIYSWDDGGLVWADRGLYQSSGIETIRNLVANGDFSKGTSEWLSSSTSTIGALNDTLSITGSGTTGAPLRTYSKAMPVLPNDKVFCKMRVRVTNPNATSVLIKLKGSISGTVAYILNQATPIENEWYDVNMVLTLPSDFDGNVQFEVAHVYLDATTATGKVLELQYMLLTDLTEDYGATKEPTLDEMIYLLSYFANGWFDGIAPVDTLIKFTSKDVIFLKNNVAKVNPKDDNIYLARYNADTYYVYYKPKGSKWVRHEFYRYVYAPQYADVWVTNEITTGYDANGKYPDEVGFVFTVDAPLTNRGSSHEFSYFIQGDDYRGTRHGGEAFDYFRIYCDGIPTTLSNGQCKAYDRVSLIEESHLVSIVDGTTVQAKIFKEWDFDQRGLDYRLITNWQKSVTLNQGLTWQMPVMTYDVTLRPKACKYYSHLSGDDKSYDLVVGEVPPLKQSHGFIMWNDVNGLSFKSHYLDDWIGQLDNFADLTDGNSLRPTSGTGFRKTYFTRLYNSAGTTVSAGEKWEIRTRTEAFLAE